MAVVVSLINMKGGVGKTTVASQLAHAAAADGLRVLAVDLDPQSNLSHSILGPKSYVRHLRANGPTVVQILEDYIPPGGGEGGPRRIDNAEKSTSISEVRDIAVQHGWRIFDYQIPYSRSYAKAARSGLPLADTPNAHWDRVAGFRRLKDDILSTVGVT